MNQKKSFADAAHKVLNERVSSADDVRSMYAVILGRVAETPSVISDRAGQPLLETMGGLLRSEEFTSTLDLLAEGKGLPPRDRLSDVDMSEAAAWLAELSGAEENDSPSWAQFLLEVLQCKTFADILPPHARLDEAVRHLAKIVSAQQGVSDQLQPFLSFDATAFSRSAAGRVFSVRPGEIDENMMLAPRGQLPSVLLFFTEGVGAIESDGRPETLGELIKISRAAAAKGRLGHWLFDEHTYAESVRRSSRMPRRPAVSASPYLQFLTLGDALGLSPHPLFSPTAYKTLNAGLDLEGLSPFAHYIRHGAALGLATSPLFDTDFYLTRQPYVRQEIAAGKYGSALEHFLRAGMREGCSFSPDFDRGFYLSAYPDIAAAIADGSLSSAEWHYVMSGARENRSPNRFFSPQYYAERYPFVYEEMSKLGLHSLLEHFLLVGRSRGWRVNQPPVSSTVDIDQSKALFEKRGRRAYMEALSGVFSIDAPPSSAKLSVVVPVSGQADFTAGFVKSACWAVDHLKYKRGVDTEIIIVDNGSKDHTSRLFAAQPGLRVVSFDRPIGFPAAVNAGVAVSSGDVVLVANNDIEFQADAFLRLYDAVVENPQFGVVGAKVILPNESLQEVGSVLDKNAGSYGFGRAQDAVAARGARFVEVDYASGCFIAFQRTDFDALGGLDEAYSPGYYEEVDFSLRMLRDLGKPTVVDTGLAITHYEHASFAKGRPQTVNEPLIIRNRLRLRTAHADFFNARPTRSPADFADIARKAISGRAKVLVVEDLVPSSLLGSGFGRVEEILDILAAMDIPYDIVALNGTTRIDEYKDPRARLFRAWMHGQALDDVLAKHGADYSHLWLCRTHNLNRATGAILAAKKQFGLKVICDTEALSSLRVIEQMRVQGQTVTDTDLKVMTAAELTDPLDVDLWIAVNRRERVLMEALGVGPVCEIGHAVTLSKAVNFDAPFEARDRVLFIGAVHELTSPNYDGLEWFLSDIYPKLKTQSDIRLTIAGHWGAGLAEAFKARFSDLEIDFRGSVTDVELASLYAETRVAIAPTRFAAGIPCKVIESVLAGVPIVMTDLLAEQLDVLDNPEVAFASRFDEGAQFAGWIDSLYADAEVWARQRALQADTIGAKSSLSSLTHQVEAALASAGIRP